MSPSINHRAFAIRAGAAIPIVALALERAYAATAQEAAAIALPAMAGLGGGIVLAGGSIAALIVLRARDGKVHPLAAAPFMETLLPIAITSGLVFGVALFLTGIANVF